MSSGNFETKKTEGELAESFVKNYIREISGEDVLMLTSLKEAADFFRRAGDPEKAKRLEQMGGEDLFYICLGNLGAFKETEVWDKGERRTAIVREVESELVCVEVKEDGQNGSFLWRNNNFDCESGSLGFELWDKKTKTHMGCLYGYFYPEEKENYVRPDRFCFVLCLDDQGERPFCTIWFRWDTLSERLNILANKLCPDGMLCPFWTLPEGNDPYWKENETWVLKFKDRPLNMWHIPLEDVVDLAKITMIDTPTDEEIKETIRLSKWSKYMSYDLMKTRLQYLIDHASGEIRTK